MPCIVTACLPVSSNSVLVVPGLFAVAVVVKSPACASRVAENFATSLASVAHDVWTEVLPLK